MAAEVRSSRIEPPHKRQVMVIFTDVTVGTNDLARARAFYDAVPAPLGYKHRKDLGDRGSSNG